MDTGKKWMAVLPALLFSVTVLFAQEPDREPAKETIEPKKPEIVEKTEKPATGDAARGKTYEAPEIVVTATRTERKISNVPASVAVVTKEDINKSTAQFADEALNSISGVYSRRAKFADTVTQVTMRGLGSQYRTLAMIDGIPVNDQDGQSVAWGNLPRENIERIEVVKGPFSSLYGGNAMGGAINIFTKSPEKFSAEAKAGYGTYNTKLASASYNDRYFDKLGISLSAEHRVTDGNRSNLVVTTFRPGTSTGREIVDKPEGTTNNKGQSTSSGYPYYVIGDTGENWFNQWLYNGSLYYDFTKDTRLKLAYSFARWEYGYRDGQSYLYDKNGNPQMDGKYAFLEGNQYYYNDSIKPNSFSAGRGENNREMYSLLFNTKLPLDISFQARGSFQNNRSWYTMPTTGADPEGGPGTQSEKTPNQQIFGEVQFDIPVLKDHVFTVGAGHKEGRSRTTEYNVSDYQAYDSWLCVNRTYDGYTATDSGFAQLELKFVEMIRLYLGGRIDGWKNYNGESTEYKAATKEDKTTVYDNRWKSAVSPKAGAVFSPDFAIIDDHWVFSSIRSSFGKAFRPPTPGDLYNTWYSSSTLKTYYANPNLSPERSEAWEVGMDQEFLWRKVKVSVSYYESVITDMIYNKTVDATTVQKENSGKGVIQGYEGEVTVKLASFLKAFGNYTYNRTRIVESPLDPASVRKRFQTVPDAMYNIGLLLGTKYVDGSVKWRYVGKVYGQSDNSDTPDHVYGVYSRYEVLDVRVGVTPFEHLKIGLSVNNALDRQYFVYYVAPGRTITGDVTMKF